MTMLMANPPKISEPIGGVEYRRWLAEQDAPGAFTAPIEPATDEDLSQHRHASKREPVPPRESDFWPWAAQFLERARHPRNLSAGELLAAWCEAFDEVYPTGYGWQTFIENAVAAGLDGAADELESLDDEPLGADAFEEKLAIRMLWARSRHVRKIERLTGAECIFVDDLTNDEVFDWLDDLNYCRSAWKLAMSPRRKGAHLL